MNDLLYLAKILIEKYEHTIKHEKWYDAGHSTTYFDTKNSSFSSRFFNEIKYNHKRNCIIEKSQEKIKLKNEIKFYKNIPSKLKVFFPILLSKDLEENGALELEYLPFPNLSEIFLFRKIAANRWESIVKSLFNIYSEFYFNDKSENFYAMQVIFIQENLNKELILLII